MKSFKRPSSRRWVILAIAILSYVSASRQTRIQVVSTRTASWPSVYPEQDRNGIVECRLEWVMILKHYSWLVRLTHPLPLQSSHRCRRLLLQTGLMSLRLLLSAFRQLLACLRSILWANQSHCFLPSFHTLLSSPILDKTFIFKLLINPLLTWFMDIFKCIREKTWISQRKYAVKTMNINW